MPSVDLAALARAGQFDALEVAWLNAVASATDPAPFLQAAEALKGAPAEDRAAPLLLLLAESFDARGTADAAGALLRVVEEVLARGGEEEPLRPLALRALERLHGREPAFPIWRDVAGLDGEGPLPEALQRFGTLRRFVPGAAVNHPRGWGVGIVESAREGTREIQVRFGSGERRMFPFASAIDFLEPLDPEDLRAMGVQRPEALKALVRDDPAEAIRRVARIRDGRATVAQLKQDLIGAALEEPAWAGWWRRARTEAARAADIAVEGSASKPVFVLRERPLSLADEGVVAIAAAPSLGAAADAARRFLADADAAARAPILDALASRSASEAGAAPADRFLAALALERHGRVGSSGPGEVLASVLRAGTAAVAGFLRALPGDRERRWAFDAIRAAAPDRWEALLLEALPGLSWEAAETTVEALRKGGRGRAVAQAFAGLLEAPSRGPGALAALCELAEREALEGVDPVPTVAARLRGILSLAEFLASGRRSSKEHAHTLKRLVSFLCESRGAVIRRLCDAADREAARETLDLVGRTREFPADLAALVRARLLTRFPEFVVREERNWWDEDAIFSTRAGIERQREAHRVLVQEKIPENSRQIGEAAAHGDLSENSEWEAAIRNRGFLTERARVLGEELARARAIEEQHIPEGIVVPGVRARLADASTGAEREVVVLGPWDQDGRDVISYRAPLGSALLGRRVGDRVAVELPEGSVEVVVKAVERAVGQPARLES